MLTLATPEDDDERDRQLLLLALAELALRRPGWDETLRRLAGRLRGGDLFDEFKRLNSDVIEPIAAMRSAARASYRDDGFAERPCDHCGKPYRGPAVYCSLECAIADA